MFRGKTPTNESRPLAGSSDVVAGTLAGLLLESVALEGCVHQDLSHRTLKFSEPIKRVSHYALALCGLSPSRAAAHHRVHHLTTDEPSLGFVGSIKYVLDSTAGSDAMGEMDVAQLLFDGYDPETDPLLEVTDDGSITYKDISRIEEFASRNVVARFTPLVASTLALAACNKMLGREKPLQRASLFMGSMVATTSMQIVATAYAEARSGRINNQLSAKGLLASRLRNHQLHHDRPDDHTAGSSRRHQFAFSILHRLGQVELHEKLPV